MLIVEQEKAGRDLKAAYERAGEYFGAAPERDLSRYILECIFQSFELHDPNERETITFSHADRQRTWIGFVQRRKFRDRDAANSDFPLVLVLAAMLRNQVVLNTCGRVPIGFYVAINPADSDFVTFCLHPLLHGIHSDPATVVRPIRTVAP